MSEERDQNLARQLAALLRGEKLLAADDEVRGLAGFALALPWPEARPLSTFMVNLRYKLLSGSPARKGRRSEVPVWSYAVALAVVVVVVLGVLVLLGPRISMIYGSVYNSLDSPSIGYGDRTYNQNAGSLAPAAAPTAILRPVPQSNPANAPGASPLPQAGGTGAAPGNTGPANPAAAGHMVVKNAQVVLLVEDTDVAITRLTGITAQYGGYILSSQSWYDEGYKEATVVISVPSQYFEQALNRVREVATRVEQETAAGEDVTAQYVDLESQLRNLEATAERLRSFLDKTTTMDEALKINTQLSQIEGEIEQVKGEMNYLSSRAAFSSISVDLRPPRPTPTPTPTPTPKVWQPGKTAERAADVLTTITHFVVEALIWVGVVVLPIVGLPALLVVLIGWAVRKWEKKGK